MLIPPILLPSLLCYCPTLTLPSRSHATCAKLGQKGELIAYVTGKFQTLSQTVTFTMVPRILDYLNNPA